MNHPREFTTLRNLTQLTLTMCVLHEYKTMFHMNNYPNSFSETLVYVVCCKSPMWEDKLRNSLTTKGLEKQEITAARI
jgi:hypothetical protein